MTVVHLIATLPMYSSHMLNKEGSLLNISKWWISLFSVFVDCLLVDRKKSQSPNSCLWYLSFWGCGAAENTRTEVEFHPSTLPTRWANYGGTLREGLWQRCCQHRHVRHFLWYAFHHIIRVAFCVCLWGLYLNGVIFSRVSAKDQHRDVVLVDTAGRMQDNEPLMRALAKVGLFVLIEIWILLPFNI